MIDSVEKSDELTYCAGCGEDVNTYNITREDVIEKRCSYCGLTIESSVSEEAKDTIKENECVMIAEDSELIREMLKDSLIEKKVAKKVVDAVDGYEFISKLTDRFEKRLPVDLIILDIQMPIMSGINAAVAIRAIENGFIRENRRVPILFFSVKQCDETLMKVMKFCSPAQYVNKSTKDSKNQLFDRVSQVIAQLMR